MEELVGVVVLLDFNQVLAFTLIESVNFLLVGLSPRHHEVLGDTIRFREAAFIDHHWIHTFAYNVYVPAR